MHESPNVTTSRDEYGIWLNWEADAFEIRYPDQDRAFDRETLEPDELGPRLLLTCRADGRGANSRGPQRLRIEAYLPMHPDAADVPGPFSIRYYLRLLYGEWDDWPGRVQLGELKERDGRIRRQRVHYSFARPELHVVGVGGYAQQALAQIEARRAWRLQVEGDELRVDASFPRQPTETARPRAKCGGTARKNATPRRNKRKTAPGEGPMEYPSS